MKIKAPGFILLLGLLWMIYRLASYDSQIMSMASKNNSSRSIEREQILYLSPNSIADASADVCGEGNSGYVIGAIQGQPKLATCHARQADILVPRLQVDISGIEIMGLTKEANKFDVERFSAGISEVFCSADSQALGKVTLKTLFRKQLARAISEELNSVDCTAMVNQVIRTNKLTVVCAENCDFSLIKYFPKLSSLSIVMTDSAVIDGLKASNASLKNLEFIGGEWVGSLLLGEVLINQLESISLKNMKINGELDGVFSGKSFSEISLQNVGLSQLVVKLDHRLRTLDLSNNPQLKSLRFDNGIEPETLILKEVYLNAVTLKSLMGSSMSLGFTDEPFAIKILAR